MRRHSLPQGGRHPESGIPSHPLRLEVATGPRPFQHLQGQRRLAPILPPRFRHPRRRTTLHIRCPPLGQIQPLVHQRPPTPGPHMGQKQPSLAVGDLPQRPAVLSDYSHRLHSLLGKVAAVQQPHRLRILQSGTQILLQPTNHTLIIPGRFGEKSRQHSWRCRNHLRQILGVAPHLGLHQQARQVMTTVLPRLLAAKDRRKVGVKVLKGLVHPLKVCRIHRSAPPPEAFSNLAIILPYQPSL